MRIILSELIFELVNFLNEKKISITKGIFSDAADNGFSIDKAQFFRLGFRYQFYNYLQTSYQEEFTEESMDYLIDRIIWVLKLTKFDEDPKKDFEIKKKEVKKLAEKHSIVRSLDISYKNLKKDYKERKKGVKYKRRYQRKIEDLQKESSESVRNAKTHAVVKLMNKHGLYESNERFFFNEQEYGVIKDHLLDIEEEVNKYKNEIKKIIQPVFANPILIDIGRKKLQAFPPLKGSSVEKQAEKLIKEGYTTFIFYGTSGGVKHSPVQTFIIPETIYFYPEAYYRVNPRKYFPLPIENILLSDTGSRYFNTDNFYKTRHTFVSATYQEDKGFFRKILRRFKSERPVSIDMDLAPLAKTCMEHNAGFGGILYNTDELKGAHQDIAQKGFYSRQMILSFLRAFDSKSLEINNRNVEDLFENEFKQLMRKVINDLVKSQEKPKEPRKKVVTPMEVLGKQGMKGYEIGMIKQLWDKGNKIDKKTLEDLGIVDHYDLNKVVKIFNNKLEEVKEK